jgi:plastocyanin
MAMLRRLSILRLFLFGLATASVLDAAGTVQVVMKDVKGQPVADAVASLTRLDAPGPAPAPPDQPVAIVQQNEEFRPYVTPLVVGTRVIFPNEDKIQHHVFSLSPAKQFDIPLYSGTPKESVVFDQPGIVTLGCNIHDWMKAYVVVLATPYYAKAGDDGRAAIGGLPAGRYHLEVWHPLLAVNVDRDIVIGERDDSTQVISLTLKPDRRIRRAPDAPGGGYK